MCRRGGIGRRPGLKIPWVVIPVPVRPRSPVPITSTSYRRGVEQLVARRAHNPEAEGSSPSPATKIISLKPSCPKGFSVLHFLEVDQENGKIWESINSIGSVKNVGVADTPKISEPLSFLKNHCFPTGSYGSICRCSICRIQAVLFDRMIRTAGLKLIYDTVARWSFDILF